MMNGTTLIERIIIRKLIEQMATAGFTPVSVWDSEEYVPATTAEAVIDHLYAVDADCTIHFARTADLKDWGNLGVLAITGNGVDIISDYHCGDEAFSRAVDAVYEWIEKMDNASCVEQGYADAEAETARAETRLDANGYTGTRP